MGFLSLSHARIQIQGFGSMFLTDHMLLFVQHGTNTVRHGKMEYVVRENEMILLKKATLIEYHKVAIRRLTIFMIA